MSPPSRFEFNAKRVFLTYPQVGDVPRSAVVRRLRLLGPDKLCVSTERHTDGGLHFHALAQWSRPLHTRDQRHFDVDGLHPNIQPVRNLRAVYRYVTKDGDFEGDVFEFGRESCYGKAVSAADRSEFLSVIRDEDPRSYVLRHGDVTRYADKHWPEKKEEYKHPSDSSPFILPDDLTSWVEDEFPKVGHFYKPLTLTLTDHLTRGLTLD